LPGTFGTIWRTPSRGLIIIDKLGRDAVKDGTYREHAYRGARQAGLKIDTPDWKRYVDNAIAHPTAETTAVADALAGEATYTRPFAPIVEQGMRAADNVLYAFLYAPFKRTPVRLIQAARDWTPGLQLTSNLLKDKMRQGGAMADEAVAQVALSQMFFHQFYNMAASGQITGGGPVNLKQRQEWLKRNKPYTFNGGPLVDFNYRVFEPLGSMMAWAADYAEAYGFGNEDEREQVEEAIILSTVRLVQNNAWWKVPLDIGIIMDEIRSGRPFEDVVATRLAEPLVTMTTGGPIGQGIARAMDGVRREATTFVDEWKRRMMFFSTDVDEMTNMFGEPVIIPPAVGGAAATALMPFLTYPREPDPLLDHLRDIGLKPAQWPPTHVLGPARPRTFGSIVNVEEEMGINLVGRKTSSGGTLRGELGRRLRDFKLPVELSGEFGVNIERGERTTRESMQALLDDPTYQVLNRAQQRTLQGEIYTAYTEATKQTWISDVHPELIEEKVEEMIRAAKPLLRNDRDRQMLQDRIGEFLKTGEGSLSGTQGAQ